MDVVSEQVDLMDADLSLATIQGKGTTFKIDFPVPHLLVSCLLVQCGDSSFAIPTEQILTISLWESLYLSAVEDSSLGYRYEVHLQGNKEPIFDLLAYWQPKYQNRDLNDDAIAICVKTESELPNFWLFVDQMLYKQELKIQSFPSPLLTPQGLMGLGLQTDNSLMPVIEVNALGQYLFNQSQGTMNSSSEILNTEDLASEEESQTILIVDDAALIRRRIEVSLSAYGYQVHNCADGLEAWNWLQINPYPLLMITDIEMPHLDGFSLIDRCRDNEMDFPIMVISSRLAEEWSKESKRLGANDFLTKGFSTGELIDKVSSLLQS